MKRIAKVFLGVFAGLLAVLILLLIGINLYLQSANVQSRIGQATAQAFGSPVKVSRTLYTPWSGLSLSGLSVADPILPDTKMMEATRFSVKFEFFPLLQRRFVISEINLTDPRFVLRQTDDEQWVVVPPSELLPVEPRRTPAATPRPNQSTTTAPAPGGAGTGRRTADAAPPYKVELRKFSIRRGSVLMTDRRGRPVVVLENVRIEGEMKPDGTVAGSIRIDELAFGDRLHPRKLRAEFTQDGPQLSVTEIKSALAGGAIRGEFHARTPARGQPQFDLRLRLDDVSVPEIIDEAHGDGNGAEGTLLGEFRLKGTAGKPETFTGRGQFDLVDGRLKPLDFIRQIGKVLRIDELQTLDLERAELRLDVRDERVHLTDLTLQTENLIINATGPIDFDGELDLDGRLLVNEKIQRGLRGLLNDNFTPSENADYKQVAFKIYGQTSRPETDLAERVLGDTVGKYLGGFLKGMFKQPEPKKKKKNKPETRAPDDDSVREASNPTRPATPAPDGL